MFKNSTSDVQIMFKIHLVMLKTLYKMSPPHCIYSEYLQSWATCIVFPVQAQLVDAQHNFVKLMWHKLQSLSFSVCLHQLHGHS